MENLIVSTEFWRRCEEVETCLRRNLGDVFVLLEICLAECSKLEQKVGKIHALQIWNIVSERWLKKMYNPLHLISALLNPKSLGRKFPEHLLSNAWQEFFKKRVPQGERSKFMDE